MKIKRYKRVSKYTNFYINSFGFRKPYQVLVDGTFCLAALNNKVNIADNISKYLKGELKLLTTSCAIHETEILSHKLRGSLLILKQYSHHKCGHELKPLSGAECFLSMIGKQNNKHYIVATQDRELQMNLREIPGVPLLYLHSRVPVLDPPSPASYKAANMVVNEKYGIQENEKQVLEELKFRSELVNEEKSKKKRKGPRGPNPLSCKKKQKKVEDTIKKDNSNGDIQKKPKKKIRISKHIVEELFKSKNKN